MLAKDLPPEHSGLAALPAENMHDMGSEQMMAGGGIVAFDDNQDQPVRLGMEGSGDDYPIFNVGDAISNVGSWMGKNWEKNKQIREGTYNAANPVSQGAVANRDAYRSAPAVPAITPEMQAEIDKQSAANPPGGQKAPGGVPTPPAVAPGAQPPAGIGEPPKRVDRFAGLGETQETFDKKLAAEQNAGKSEFLMNMGLKMMTTVGPLGKAIGEGGIAGLPSLSASRKTVRELEKNRTDYQLNMAKAQTAADEGNDDLAYKYKALAEKTAHDAGMLAVEKTKAGAYANAIGTKQDVADQRRETSIMGIAKGLLEKNMKYNMPNTKPEERQAMEQAAINSAVNMYNSASTATKGSAGFKYLGKET